MPDIDQITAFRHCLRLFSNLCRRYAACAAKRLAERARETRRWPENLNWQTQGCTVVATHTDNLYQTIGRPSHLDKAKWNVYYFCSRSVSWQTAELPRCSRSLPRKRKLGGKKDRTRAANVKLPLTYCLTPPGNRLSFLPCSPRRKTQPPSMRIRLSFCWESLPAVPSGDSRMKKVGGALRGQGKK